MVDVIINCLLTVNAEELVDSNNTVLVGVIRGMALLTGALGADSFKSRMLNDSPWSNFLLPFPILLLINSRITILL